MSAAAVDSPVASVEVVATLLVVVAETALRI